MSSHISKIINTNYNMQCPPCDYVHSPLQCTFFTNLESNEKYNYAAKVPYPGILSILAKSHSLLHKGHTLLVFNQR